MTFSRKCGFRLKESRHLGTTSMTILLRLLGRSAKLTCNLVWISFPTKPTTNHGVHCRRKVNLILTQAILRAYSHGLFGPRPNAKAPIASYLKASWGFPFCGGGGSPLVGGFSLLASLLQTTKHPAPTPKNGQAQWAFPSPLRLARLFSFGRGAP